ncbi:hypothetical protein BDV28DRAFT_80227 [Aspergillus coremiiformis]|uniref:GPI-anchored cell surface glycoprotein n=1 Tax=Aspergillus coremiiformis TaxID=138285 RepID=A0A5N6YT86_9EURO|nr:hypothetical protein BDV28DRAFT_80227 [Aspergillus coremiiformis]
MVDSNSVTCGEASPGPSVVDLTPNKTFSHTSRQARRELELNTSHPSRLAYSLPPTPIASSFEEALSSPQRNKRHRSVNYYEKTPQSKGVETSDHKTPSFSAQPSGSTSRKSSRSRRSDNTNKETVKACDATGDQAVTPSSSNAKHKSQSEQSTQPTDPQDKPQNRRKTSAGQAEVSDKKKPKHNPSNPSNMGAAISSNRKTRKSMPAKLNGAESAESAEKATPKSKLVTRLATPLSRKDRKSKGVVQSDRVPKSTPRAKSQSTPAVNSTSKAAKAQTDGATDPVTPAERAPVSTPNNTTTRSRRRDRKSARRPTTDRSQRSNVSSHPATVTNTDETEERQPAIQDSDKSAAQDSDNGSSEPQQTKKRPSNTVTLNLGRKSLESFVQKTLEPMSHSHEVADSVEGTPVHVYDDSFHFDYDADMYRNNFGLDGQMDAPASPTSFSTTTSTAARTSGRTRKPTIRALESLESERRFRRPRAQTPGKAGASAREKPDDKPSSAQKSAHQSKTAPAEPAQAPPAQASPTQALSAPPHLDVAAFARRIFELAVAAVSDDFVPVTGADTWLEELRKEHQGKGKTEVTAAGAVVEGESRPPSENNPTETWTDEDGWMHTGQVNDFGEEVMIVGPDFEWYRPNNTYGDKQLPLPPVRLRSLEQSAKDRIFGFPPRIGERNLPHETNLPFVMEDVYHERAKIKAREAARQKGITVDRSMSVAQIEALIGSYGTADSLQASEASAPVKSSKHDKPVRSRKRRRTEPVPQSEAPSTKESTTGRTQKPKKRRKNTVGTSAPTPTPTPIPTEPEPSSEKPKTLKLKLIFSKRELPAASSSSSSSSSSSTTTTTTTNTTNTSDKSKKRPHSEIETDGDNSASNRPSKSPKLTPPNPTATPKRLLKLSTPKQGQKEKNNAAPTSAPELPAPEATTPIDQNSHTTPGGRPRRRAAAALMAEFQNHKEERARRANARRKTNTDIPNETNPGQSNGLVKQP